MAKKPHCLDADVAEARAAVAAAAVKITTATLETGQLEEEKFDLLGDLLGGAEPVQPWRQGGPAITGSHVACDADSLVFSARGRHIQPEPPLPPTTLAPAALPQVQ